MEFFSWQTLGSLAGAALAVVLITNVVKMATDFQARWVAVVAALLVQMLVWWFASDKSIEALVLAIINSLVVYAAATGGNEITAGLSQTRISRSMMPEEQFWSSWWQR